jgi:hypothetical protein
MTQPDATVSNYRHMTRTSRGWERMWQEIASKYGDAACQHPESGEQWQYMGTVRDGRIWHHEFRHRELPATGKRAYDAVSARDSDFEEQA